MNTKKTDVSFGSIARRRALDFEFKRSSRIISRSDIFVTTLEVDMCKGNYYSEKLFDEVSAQLSVGMEKVIVGFWLGSAWIPDSAYNRRFGWKTSASRELKEVLDRGLLEFVEREGMIRPLVEIVLEASFFWIFVLGISDSENGAIFCYDRAQWKKFRNELIEFIKNSRSLGDSPCMHFSLVQLSIDRSRGVAIATRWYEENSLDIDILTFQAQQ